MSQVRYKAFDLLPEAERARILKTWQRPGARDPFTRADHWAFPLDARGEVLRRSPCLEPAYTLAGERREQFWSPEGGLPDA